MKKQGTGFALAAAALLCLSGPVAAMAAIVNPGAGPTSTGIPYTWGVTMNGNDTTDGSPTPYQGIVGALSWSDPFNDGDPIGAGWTHTSNWTALGLTEAANLTVTLAETTTPSPSGLYPAFSLYAGQQTTDLGSALGCCGWHVYNNAGNFDWSTANPTYDSSSLNYIGNEANLGHLSSVTKVFSLEPGLYTLVFGGNARDVTGATLGFDIGYQATLTTAPVPVPAAVWLFGSGLAGLVGLARRRRVAA